MNRVLKAVAVAIFSVCVVSWQLQAGVVNITQGSTSGYTMTDGNTYVIKNSVSFSNSTAGGSGMSIADNATVVLHVPAGVTLTATGANGSGQIGGGAGIRVPETSTLVITGEGIINATGGDAGNGGDGADGLVGSFQTKTVNSLNRIKGYSGAGGSGGAGGGGAGVGIGGAGGYGGNGGSGGAAKNVSSYVDHSDFKGDGNVGAAGGAGESGETMGVCYVIGTTVVIVGIGNSGIAGVAGNNADWFYEGYVYNYPAKELAACGGGGGGGGGAGGSPSCAVGGGGSSGGGGGGAGSGAILYGYGLNNNGSSGLKNANGGGGGGGDSLTAVGCSGVEKGSSLTGNTYWGDWHVYYGGDGGAGGTAGAEGGAGTLYVSPTATVNVDRAKLSATTHLAAQYTITFDANGGQFSSAVESLTATLGCVLPNCIPAPTRRGYLFDGWRTAAGEEYYGTSGAKSMSSYPVVGNVTLYAQWQVDETYVDHTVTTPEEVPYSYFDNNYPTLLAEHGGDYEAAALATAANGHNKVWECFVAGISPTNETSSFVAKIEMVDGMPIVTWDPDLNTNGVVRTYKVYGKETLEAGGEWQYPTNSLHRFFKVTVEMP